ncbi:MAG: PilZ domain-containing protein, partial [Myxococcaceae bacterium]
PNGKLGGLTVDGPLPGALGQRCALVVRAASPATRHFNVRGQLAWARHKGSRGLKECFGIDFLAEDDAGRQRLLSFAREEVQPTGSRFEERLYTDLPVTISNAGRVRKEVLFDLSQGGAFVRTALPAPVGTHLAFDMRPPLSLTRLRLKGRVAWVRLTGPARGMGVQFLFDNAAQAERVLKLLRRLER